MNIGLVLSGGGIRGVAHIGAIKALEEYGIYPTHISGTSAGAIVGALYARGLDWSEILDFFKTTSIFHAKKYARRQPGFIDTEKFYNDFKNYLPEDSFSALKKPLFVTATNVENATLKIFHKGELIRPVLASATFPGVFTPIEIDGSYYVDGGVLNNFPVEPLKAICERIIGVYVNPLKKVTMAELKHSYNVAERAYKIKSSAESIQKFTQCNLVIHPEALSNFSTFEMYSIDTIFDLGYAETQKLLQEKNPFDNDET